MFKCIKCWWGTNFKNGLCKKCYAIDHWLTPKHYKYHYDMIKWRIAETLIQELFLACNFDVFHYGMENTIPGIMELLQGVRTDVAQDIRRAPDFVIHKRGTNDFYFTEVKFRANWFFSMKDNIDADYPYHNAYFIIVSKKSIKCLSYDELKSGEIIDEASNHYLSDRKEFNLNKDIVEHFRKFAVQFFERA